jgi:cobalt/nickel transport system permease protein
MHHTFDRYLHHDSPLHRLDPRIKIVVMVVFVIATLLLPDGAWLALALSWLCVWLTSWLAGLPYRVVFKRSLIILPFLLTALTLLFNTPGDDLISWTTGSITATITAAGLVRFASVIGRGWLAIQAAILLTAVTQFPDLIHGLNHLRVPAILVNIISFMYRYLFVLADEAQRMMRARQARSARLPGTGAQGGSLVWRAKVTGYMVGQLFSRSLDRSDRVYQAMLARGYKGRLLTMTPHAMTRPDWATGLLALLAILAIQIVARLS